MNGPLDASLPILEEQIRDAVIEAAQSARTALAVLEDRYPLDSAAFMAALGLTLNLPVARMADMVPWTPAFDLVTYHEAATRKCLVFRNAGQHFVVVLSDPFRHELSSWLDGTIPGPYATYLSHSTEIEAYLSRYEESHRAVDSILEERIGNEIARSGAEDLSLLTISGDSSPVVKLVNSTIYDALKAGASDVHIETDASGLTIKYRVDGVLVTVGSTPGPDFADQVISRIKVVSGLDISERRIPQDGRFKIAARGREIDFRVSVMPSIFGEDAVLRILDRHSTSDSTRSLRLDHLGFDPVTLTGMRELINQPYGMVLVTGPTGSGKTTSTYAAISEVNNGRDKIITIEDPVEYQLPGVLQIPVNEKKGLTFARGLRSILRHDPDKIMVGEIRDPETAQIAIQSALTGHLVFTTVHANNVFDVVGRFMHMGVDTYSFVSALNGILAQRLVRVICTQCATDYTPPSDLLLASRLPSEATTDIRWRIGQGCGHCRGSGYKGRKAVGELLYLNDEIRELIIRRESVRHIKEAACRNGTRYLREAAMDLVRSGETTLEEINRVTALA